MVQQVVSDGGESAQSGHAPIGYIDFETGEAMRVDSSDLDSVVLANIHPRRRSIRVR